MLHYTGHGLESSCLAFEVRTPAVAQLYCAGCALRAAPGADVHTWLHDVSVQDAKGAMHAMEPHALRNLMAAGGGATDIQVRAACSVQRVARGPTCGYRPCP